jgi:hypothetical protein
VEAYVKELKDPEATDETHIMIDAGYGAAYAQISEVMFMNQVYYTKEVENSPILDPYISKQPHVRPIRAIDRREVDRSERYDEVGP